MTRYRPSAVATALVCAILLAVLGASARGALGVPRAQATTLTATWTSKSLAPDRAWAASTYMPLTDEVLVYGGGIIDRASGGMSEFPTDTLIYNPRADIAGGTPWTTPPVSIEIQGGLPHLVHHTLSWDPEAGVAVMFGGVNVVQINQTYGYDPSRLTWTKLINAAWNSTAVPSARSLHAQAWSSVLRKTLVFGGSARAKNGSVVTNDLWALGYDRNRRVKWQWTRLNAGTKDAPPARSWHGMAEIPSGTHAGKMLIYGGWDNNGQPLSDTWVYDPASNTYEQITSAGAPKPRVGFGMASSTSPALNAVVIQGGQTNSSRQGGGPEDFSPQTWAFDGKVWVRVGTDATDPVGNRSGHDLVSDSTGSVFLFDQPNGMPRQPTWVLK